MPITIVFVWAAVQNTRDWVAYKQQEFIFPSPGGWKSKIRVAVWSASGEGPPPVPDC